MAQELFSHSSFYLQALSGIQSTPHPSSKKPGALLGQSRVQIVREVKALFMADHPLSEESRHLLDNIIKAMKLSEQEAIFEVIDKSWDSLIDTIYSTYPRYIVTLGANACNFLLRKKERLTDLRGHLYPRFIKHPQRDLSVKVLPLFHPDFLLINPSMKATAWSDLQLIFGDGLHDKD